MSLPHARTVEATEPIEPSDVELIAAVRSGDGEAYGRLYERHLPSARHLARQLTRSPAEVDDLTSEAFAKVLDTLRSGGGPTTAFRAYLLTTLRNTLYDRARRDRRLELSDDMTRHDPGVPWVDTAVAGLESSLAARAFARLPERWQTVLWHTEVEQETPAQLAPMLGMTPNGVAALAYRAREGLRQAYLREHLSELPLADQDGESCRWTVERLGAWARGGLSKRERIRVDEHLAGCQRCRPLAAELEDVNGGLRGLIAPLVLGSAAAAYLSSTTSEAAAAAGAGAASAAGVGAGAAGTAGAGTAGTAGAAGAGTAAAAAAGAGAAGIAAGAVAVEAGGAAVGGGSALTTLAGWVLGTHVGQAAAAAVTAVVVGGTAVGVGIEREPEGARSDSSISTPADPSARTALPSGLTGAASPGGVPGAASTPGGPGAGSSPGAPGSGAPVTPAPGGAGSQSGRAPGQPAGAAMPSDASGQASAAGRPTGSAEPSPTVPPALDVGTPAPTRPLQAGEAGEIDVPVRNAGGGPATDVVATVTLPPGVSVRAGGTDSPAEWRCSGTGDVATCRVSTLPAGAAGTVRVKVQVSLFSAGGTVSGNVTADGLRAEIPPAVVTVLPF